MPVTPASLTPNLVAAMASHAIVGVASPTLASAIAIAFSQFLPTIPVTTAHVGVMGAGTGTGRVVMDPVAGGSLIQAQLLSSGLAGVISPALASAIAGGISGEMNAMAVVQVVITGTATGTGTGVLAGANPQVLAWMLTGAFAGHGMTGVALPQLAPALALGITGWLGVTGVSTLDVGTPAPPYTLSAGVGLGTIS